MTSECEITEMTDEQAQNLKEISNASDEEIERFRNSTFKEIRIRTIDPRSGEVICYLFDSLRCVAQGKGRLEGNKEIMEWKWSGAGQGTSVSVIEKVSDNEFTISGSYIQPDGKTMEGGEYMTMTRIMK